MPTNLSNFTRGCRVRDVLASSFVLILVNVGLFSLSLCSAGSQIPTGGAWRGPTESVSKIESLYPAVSPADRLVCFRVMGTGFVDPDSVCLERPDGTRLSADFRFVSAETLFCGVDLNGEAPGIFGIVIENPDGSMVEMQDAFTVTPPVYWSHDVQITASSTVKPGVRAAAAPDGDVWLVWAESYHNYSQDILACHGRELSWSPPESVTTDANTNFRPRIAVDPLANLHVVWYDVNTVFYREREAGTWLPETTIIGGPDYEQYPYICSDPSGGLHLVWKDYRNDHLAGLYYKCRTDGEWGADESLSVQLGQDVDMVVATDAASNVHVAWSGDPTGGGGQDLYYRVRNGTGWSDATVLAVGFYPKETAIAVSAAGAVHVAWIDNSRLHHRWLGPEGWSEDVEICTNSSRPSLAADSFGGVHLVWSSGKSGNTEIYHRKHNGFRWTDEERLTNDIRPSTDAVATIDPQGETYVAWIDERSGSQNVHMIFQPGSVVEQPELLGLSLTEAPNFGMVEVTATGHGFLAPAILELRHPGTPTVVGTTIAEGAESLRVRFNLTDVPAAGWTVCIVNGNGQPDSLPDAFVTANSPWGPPDRLTNMQGLSNLAESGGSAMVRDGDGNLHVVYQDGGAYGGIFWTRRMGGVWEEPFQMVDSWTQDGGAEPAIAIMGNGHPIVAWTDTRDGSGEIYTKVWTGTQWGQDVRATWSGAYSRYPALATDADGVTHLVWNEGVGDEMQVFHSTWDGGVWADQERISIGAGESMYPSIVSDGRVKLYVAWARVLEEESYPMARVLTGSGWSEEIRLTGSTTASYPSLASDGNGMVYGAWRDHKPGAPSAYERRLDIDEQERFVASMSGSNFSRVKLAITPEGDRHFIWTDRVGYWLQVRLRSYEDGAWSLVHDLSASSRGASNGHILAGPEGAVDVVWQDDRNGSSDQEIYYRGRDRFSSAVPGDVAGETLPFGFAYPNPFTDRIWFALTQAGGPVWLRLYDCAGRRVVETLLQPSDRPAKGPLVWMARDAHGRRLAPGPYFYRIEGPTSSRAGSVVCIR